jgi:hypothetical protein
MTKTLHILFLAAALFLVTASFSQAQELRRWVKQAEHNKGAPIEIMAVNVGSQSFKREFSVMGDSGWWKELTLDVKNVSEKNILSFDIEGHFYMPADAIMGMSLPFRFNSWAKEADSNAFAPGGEKKIGMLAPGETIRIKMQDWILKQYEPLVATYGYESVQGMQIDIRTIYFEDKSQWSFGKYLPARETKTEQ